MRYFILSFFVITTLISFGQENQKGIPFVHGKHWSEIVKMAKKENKYIFVDCFTTWCGPCKMMSSEVFSQEKVGAFFKKNFISLKAQMDKTKKDAEDIKSLYPDFEEIEKKYEIQVYPTFLFFSPEGNLVHKFVGGMPAEAFIEKAGQSLNPNTQYITLKSSFADHKNDTAYLRRMIKAAAESYEDASVYFDAYTLTQPDMFTKENAAYIELLAENPNQSGFKLIAANPEKYDALTEKGKAEDVIINVLSQTTYRNIFPKDSDNPDKEKIASIEKNYPRYAKRLISLLKVSYYSRTGKWALYNDEIFSYMNSYGTSVSNPMQLNDFAWNVFENCSKKEILEAALGWSKSSLTGEFENYSAYLDTYANLLYKLGRKDEAIKTEEKALVSDKENPDGYRETLEKMKKGEKTWKD